MKKSVCDPKVKKTLVRNYEVKIKPSAEQVVYDVGCSSQKSLRSTGKENNLAHPSLCSSEAVASYINDLKKMTPPLSSEDINVDKCKHAARVTKQLNFHFNDRIYKNLIELNANVSEMKNKKDRRSTSRPLSMKKDLEPKIEDFYEDEKEFDSPPKLPSIKMNFRPIKKVEMGRLHKLVAALEDL